MPSQNISITRVAFTLSVSVRLPVMNEFFHWVFASCVRRREVSLSVLTSTTEQSTMALNFFLVSFQKSTELRIAIFEERQRVHWVDASFRWSEWHRAGECATKTNAGDGETSLRSVCVHRNAATIKTPSPSCADFHRELSMKLISLPTLRRVKILLTSPSPSKHFLLERSSLNSLGFGFCDWNFPELSFVGG